jgi:hypothetical protein
MTTTYTTVFGGNNISPALDSYISYTLTANLQLVWPQETAPNSNLAAQIMEVSAATAGSFALIMPPANAVSQGQFLLVNNLSAFTQTIQSFGGAVIATVGAGAIFFLYIQNNATQAGNWITFQYGAAIAIPSVAAIAGAGLLATGATLSQDIVVATFNVSPVTLGINNRAQLINWQAGSGSGNANLPLSSTVGASWYVQFKNSATSPFTITPQAGDNINSQVSGALITLQPNDSCFLVTDGLGDWYSIGLGTTQPVFFNYQAIALGGASNPVSIGTTAGTSLNKIAYKFTGVLTQNLIIDLPAYAQTYWVNNATTGAFSLTFQVPTVFPGGLTPAGTTQLVPQGIQEILYSDGSNVINAVSGSGFGGYPVLISQGGTGATTAGGAVTNLGGTSIGSAVFTAVSNAAAQAAIAAASTADAVVLSQVF